MKVNYAFLRNKMEKEFAWVKKQCIEAGMPDEAIEEIHRIMLDEVNNNRKYYTHIEPLDDTDTSEEHSNESWSPLYKQYLEQLSICQCEITQWGRYDWIEDLDTTKIILWAKTLSSKDIELITYLMEDGLQKQEIAHIFECSPSAISKRVKHFRKQLSEILSKD